MSKHSEKIYLDSQAAIPQRRQLRRFPKNTLPILLVFLSVFCVVDTVTEPGYATVSTTQKTHTHPAQSGYSIFFQSPKVSGI
ncbi:MAG: hypothetical protein GY801_49540 [bacterium]|nr:hypothetical protein [bacterium]